MPPAGFEPEIPASELLQTDTFFGAVIGIGNLFSRLHVPFRRDARSTSTLVV
jgi:hypothetical protein